MAFRAEIFRKHGGFRTDLGRSAESMLGNEDTELGRRLLAGGERLWFEPLAIVYHGIPENRLTKSYFLGFWFNYGRAAVREHANRSNVWKIPRWCFSVPIIIFNVLPARLRLWLFARDPKRRFFFKCTVWRTFGEIFELPRIWLETKRRLKRRTSESSELRSSDVTLGE
jgi:GT2 family glycosyltransferase